MQNLTEAKPQCWRAVAIFDNGDEQLLYLGRSSTQVRSGYTEPFLDLLDDEERDRVTEIGLQRWNGAADAGRWQQQATLKLPTDKLARSA